MALIMVPEDMARALVCFGAEQAMLWTGMEPDRNEFYSWLGHRIADLRMIACEKASEGHHVE